MVESGDLSRAIWSLRSRRAATVGPESSLAVVARLMQIAQVSLVAVVDQGNLVGAVSKRSLMAAIADGESLGSVVAREVMTSRFVTVTASTPIVDVAAVMADDDSSTVIVRHERGLATVTNDDILDFALRHGPSPENDPPDDTGRAPGR